MRLFRFLLLGAGLALTVPVLAANDTTSSWAYRQSYQVGWYHYQEYHLPRGIAPLAEQVVETSWRPGVTSTESAGWGWAADMQLGSGVGRYNGYELTTLRPIKVPMATYLLNPTATVRRSQDGTTTALTMGYHWRMEKMSTTTRDARYWVHADLTTTHRFTPRWRASVGVGYQFLAGTTFVAKGDVTEAPGKAHCRLPSTTAWMAGIGYKYSSEHWIDIGIKRWSTGESPVADTSNGWQVMEPASHTTEVSVAWQF